MKALFHLAYHVTDLDAARRFYGGVLGCREGRSTDDLGRLRLLRPPDLAAPGRALRDHATPAASASTWCRCRTSAWCCELPDWQALAERLRAAGIDFVLEPQVRFEGQPGEQWTMFFRDPSGNPIEVKGFASLDTVYDA